MYRDQIVARLREQADAVRGLGVTSLYLFGSAARNELMDASDIDIFVDYDRGSRFSLVELVAIKQLLEAEVKAEVDITTRDSLHPMLREAIERSAIRVF